MPLKSALDFRQLFQTVQRLELPNTQLAAAAARVSQLEHVSATLPGLLQVQPKVWALLAGLAQDRFPGDATNPEDSCCRGSLPPARFAASAFLGKAGQALWSTTSGLVIYSAGKCGEDVKFPRACACQSAHFCRRNTLNP